eukprot:6200586-Pleurochrysis_carterae.AAC.3
MRKKGEIEEECLGSGKINEGIGQGAGVERRTGERELTRREGQIVEDGKCKGRNRRRVRTETEKEKVRRKSEQNASTCVLSVYTRARACRDTAKKGRKAVVEETPVLPHYALGSGAHLALDLTLAHARRLEPRPHGNFVSGVSAAAFARALQGQIKSPARRIRQTSTKVRWRSAGRIIAHQQRQCAH